LLITGTNIENLYFSGDAAALRRGKDGANITRTYC
jgi:hypothetical protein